MNEYVKLLELTLDLVNLLARTMPVKGDSTERLVKARLELENALRNFEEDLPEKKKSFREIADEVRKEIALEKSIREGFEKRNPYLDYQRYRNIDKSYKES